MLLERAIAAALAALAFGGCGGVGGVESSVEARGGRIEIVLDDFLIEPQSVRAKPGRLTFAVSNRGRLGHNFRVRGRGGEPVEIATLLPGEGASETVRLRRGDYKMLCTVANHEQLGMTGRLVVR
jgi:plastocyanin